MSDLEWRTERRRVRDLIPYDRNPRRMTRKQAEDLQRSLERFNLVEIPAIDTDNRIIAGHQRIRILQALGRGDEEIDVRVPNRKLTEREFAEYNLRSNKNVGEWDYDLLANWDEDLLKDVGFDDLPKLIDASDDGDGIVNYFDIRSRGQAYWGIGEVSAPVDYELLKSCESAIMERYQPDQYGSLLESILRKVRDII